MIDVPDLRQCRTCGTWMPFDAHHFAPGYYRKNGSPGLRRDCRRCKSAAAVAKDKRLRHDPATREAYLAARRATATRYRQANLDKVHEWDARWRADVRADPERRERRNAARRANYRRRRGFGRQWWDEPDYEPLVTNSGGMVDAGPFVDFARDVYPNAKPTELARLFGLDGSGARRVFSGEHKRISLAVVDRALTVGLGRPDLLDAIYPETGL